MKMRCPCCDARGISPLAKIWSSPRLPALCSACGRGSVVPPRWAALTLLPLVFGLLLPSLLKLGSQEAWLWGALGAAVYLQAFLAWAPLVRFEKAAPAV